MWNKQQIRSKLLTDDRWLIRGVLAIYNRQTDSEQYKMETVEDNGVGFNGFDARFMSSIAQQILMGGILSIKQTAVVRRIMVKYSGQLMEIANARNHYK